MGRPRGRLNVDWECENGRFHFWDTNLRRALVTDSSVAALLHTNVSTVTRARQNREIAARFPNRRPYRHVETGLVYGVVARRCTRCLQILPLSAEYWQKKKGGNHSGWAVECKECKNLNRRQQLWKLKQEVFPHYGGFVCACCGETQSQCLQIDHINNNEEAESVCDIVRGKACIAVYKLQHFRSDG